MLCPNAIGEFGEAFSCHNEKKCRLNMTKHDQIIELKLLHTKQLLILHILE